MAEDFAGWCGYVEEMAESLMRASLEHKESEKFMIDMYGASEEDKEKQRQIKLEKDFVLLNKTLGFSLSDLVEGDYLKNVLFWSKKLILDSGDKAQKEEKEENEKWLLQLTDNQKQRMELFLLLEKEIKPRKSAVKY